MLEKNIKKIIKEALLEDEALNDITSDLLVTKNNIIKFKIATREDIIFCGKDIIINSFGYLKKIPKFRNCKIDFKILYEDGDAVKSGDSIVEGIGSANLIFATERVILNFIQHLSGISSITNKFIKLLNNKKIKILDTRKTIPNIRYIQKYAVKSGGGDNHRFNLEDMILIKDNHIASLGGINKITQKLKNNKNKIEIECDNIEQVKNILNINPTIIMLDNMSITEIKKASTLIRNYSKKIKIEVSGGINLDNIKKYSNLDIDFISIGSLTHSVKSADIGLDIIPFPLNK